MCRITKDGLANIVEGKERMESCSTADRSVAISRLIDDADQLLLQRWTNGKLRSTGPVRYPFHS